MFASKDQIMLQENADSCILSSNLVKLKFSWSTIGGGLCITCDGVGVDPLDSNSRILDPRIVGEEHYRARAGEDDPALKDKGIRKSVLLKSKFGVRPKPNKN